MILAHIIYPFYEINVLYDRKLRDDIIGRDSSELRKRTAVPSFSYIVFDIFDKQFETRLIILLLF